MKNVVRYRGVWHAVSTILKHEGASGLFRGVGAVAFGAIPAHAIYFATYEASKDALGGSESALATSVGGIIASSLSEAMLLPFDVVKQRRQISSKARVPLVRSFLKIVKTEGWGAFYRSYPTTMLMNAPYTAVYFTTYESLFPWFKGGGDGDEDAHPLAHAAAGGVAGALSAAVSTPFDVAKTRQQTDRLGRYRGLTRTFKLLLREEGAGVFFKGMRARVLFHTPAAAICWATYGTSKELLIKYT